ncbi:MAG: dephospho-CoA kinase [Spirochaetales bacterium]|nr:dephospho-CoA kinase [Spirochaetales bacterium]
MIIGLSGKCCAGKNVAAEILEEKGIPSIDVDKLGHFVLKSYPDIIKENFGEQVMAPDGSVDRKALGKIVFSDSQKLKKLEDLTHPLIEKETVRLCKEILDSGNEHIIINAPLLHKMELYKSCGAVIWIDAPILVRIKRALKRDNVGFISVIKRICKQRKLKPKPSGNCVDIYKVGNKAGLEPLKQKLEAVLNQIEQKD